MVELAWILCSPDGTVIREDYWMIKPMDYTIPDEAAKINGITTDIATAEEENLSDVL